MERVQFIQHREKDHAHKLRDCKADEILAIIDQAKRHQDQAQQSVAHADRRNELSLQQQGVRRLEGVRGP